MSRPTETHLAALEALWNMAQHDHGGANVCKKVLLGLYNGSRFPLDLTELRRLDADVFMRVLHVLAMDSQPWKEVHELLNDRLGRNDMGARFELMAWNLNLKGKCSREAYKDMLARVQANNSRAAATRELPPISMGAPS